MSLNKFMHPRNKYRKPPDFKALAIKYPHFRKYARQDISGKVSLDFKNLESVRALTCTLLKEDFNLDVEIPLDRLVPTLPLRMNYLLWIEDILQCNNIKDAKGIDIGCGASCIYPLLAVKQFGWCMLATETDCDSARIAVSNVRNNQLEDKITVKTVDKSNMLEGVVDADSSYHFCMCNPPFFSCLEELSPEHVARSPNRPPPRNAHSGSPGELVVPGGETAFVAGIIQDSVKMKTLVRVYTVMVGHKSSVSKVKQLLSEAGVSRTASTEFCQGHTTRWGIAWTLDPDIVLHQAKDVPLSNKKKTPFTHPSSLDLATTVSRLHQLLDQLQMRYSIQKSNQEINVMEITAMTNTWSNSRKKRRQEKLMKIANMTKDNKEIVPENVNDSVAKEGEESTSEVIDNKQMNNSVSELGNQADEKHPINNVGKSEESVCSSMKRSRSEDGECTDSRAPKMLKTEMNSSKSEDSVIKDPFLCGQLIVRRKGEGSVIELFWLRGVGGRDAAHQVLQHFKNNLDVH